jgi:hypothetical protein
MLLKFTYNFQCTQSICWNKQSTTENKLENRTKKKMDHEADKITGVNHLPHVRDHEEDNIPRFDHLPHVRDHEEDNITSKAVNREDKRSRR